MPLAAKLIAPGQWCIDAGLLLNGKLWLPAASGAAIFLLANVPLGGGSAFPATLFMVGGIWFLLRNEKNNSASSG